jgi:hypothetical protein
MRSRFWNETWQDEQKHSEKTQSSVSLCRSCSNHVQYMTLRQSGTQFPSNRSTDWLNLFGKWSRETWKACKCSVGRINDGPSQYVPQHHVLKHSLCPSLNVRGQVSHSYKTSGKIIVVYFIIFTFLETTSQYPPQHRVLKHSLCPSINIRVEVSHPYRTTGKSIVFYFIVFTFLDASRKRQKAPYWMETNITTCITKT